MSKSKIKALENIHKTIGDKRIADRVKSVIALATGYSFEQIEEILLISERRARRYFNIYKEMGVDGLLILNYKGGIPSLGFSYKKRKIAPSKVDKEKQKNFIKEYKKLRKEQKTDEKVYYID